VGPRAPKRRQEGTGRQVMSTICLPVELIVEHLEAFVLISHESGRTGFYSAYRA